MIDRNQPPLDVQVPSRFDKVPPCFNFHRQILKVPLLLQFKQVLSQSDPFSASFALIFKKSIGDLFSIHDMECIDHVLESQLGRFFDQLFLLQVALTVISANVQKPTRL